MPLLLKYMLIGKHLEEHLLENPAHQYAEHFNKKWRRH